MALQVTCIIYLIVWSHLDSWEGFNIGLGDKLHTNRLHQIVSHFLDQ